MLRFMMIVLAAILVIAAMSSAQEVVVTGFPLGTGRSVPAEFFEPYLPRLQALADTLEANPLILAVVTGSADGYRYRNQNDAKNPSLALGRAHALRDVLVLRLGVDSSRVVVQTQEMDERGDQFRCAKVRLVRGPAELNERLNALENRPPVPPVEKHFTEIREVSTPLEFMGLKLAAGFSSSPFGGLPIVSGALTWRQILFLEAEFGHTFWNGDYRFGSVTLHTKRRTAAGYLLYFPFESIPVGLLGGWIRAEEVAQTYHQYVKLAEGPVVGIRVAPVKYLAITGAYNPSKQRRSDLVDSEMIRDQFSLSVALQLVLGGAR